LRGPRALRPEVPLATRVHQAQCLNPTAACPVKRGSLHADRGWRKSSEARVTSFLCSEVGRSWSTSRSGCSEARRGMLAGVCATLSSARRFCGLQDYRGRCLQSACGSDYILEPPPAFRPSLTAPHPDTAVPAGPPLERLIRPPPVRTRTVPTPAGTISGYAAPTSRVARA
jgi:hypothetical protein